MRWIIAIVVALHGAIHFMGFAKAVDPRSVPQLTLTVSRAAGVWWLVAGLFLVITAVMLILRSPGWWIAGAVALVLSQVLIVTAWSDARAGTIVNAVLLLAVVAGGLMQGPGSFRVAFDREVAAGLARPLEAPLVTGADLAPLPEPVQRYLRTAGAVGQPKVRNYAVRFRGRIRSGPDARWMPFEAEQQSFADRPARFFLMRARRFGLPVEAFHRLAGGRATMHVKVLGAVPVVDAAGEVMDRGESVTLLNDMAALAPATLLDPSITWEAGDDRRAVARFVHGTDTVSATLVFGADGLLADFVSDDRARLSEDGKAFEPARFSTPIQTYGSFGPMRLPTRAEARWTLPDGRQYAYGEFEVLSVQYNVRP